MSKLSNWFSFMLECELMKENVESLNEENKEKYIKLCSEFWDFKGEDRNIVLEDLKKDEGLLYKKMCEWNKNELIKELGMSMVWWDYSLEDYFRDIFDKNGEYKDEFSLFDIKDINKMMYK